MDFNRKTYQIIKLKRYFKANDFFLLFQSAKLNLKKWISVEQDLKKLHLSYYKPLNKIAISIFNYSKYKHFSSSLSGFSLFIKPMAKDYKLSLEYTIKSLKSSFVLLSLKLNNKFYAKSQLKGLKSLSYKKNMFGFYKVLDRQLKTSYVLTFISQNISK